MQIYKNQATCQKPLYSEGPYGFPGMRNEAFSSQIKWGNIMVIRRFLSNFAPWGDKVFYIPWIKVIVIITPLTT